MTDVQDAIVAAAQAHGIDPAYALAIAERESGLKPYARSPKSSASGLFQLLDANKRRYGGYSDDPTEQATAGMRFLRDVHQTMAQHLGRDPTGPELYAGHYWGAGRAARMLSGRIDPSTPVGDVFSPREMAANPDLRRAGNVGTLTRTVLGDIDRRASKFGGAGAAGAVDFAQFGTNEPVDFAQFGQPADSADAKPAAQSAGQKLFERNKAWMKPGASNFNTDLGGDEPQFRQWVQQNKVPFDPEAKDPQDYDMRGFWRGMQNKDPRAGTAVNPNDKQLHFPDYWKTPYHETFSNESQWATPNAPKWNDKDQLIGPDGGVLFDERAPRAPQTQPQSSRPGQEIDLSQFGMAA